MSDVAINSELRQIRRAIPPQKSRISVLKRRRRTRRLLLTQPGLSPLASRGYLRSRGTFSIDTGYAGGGRAPRGTFPSRSPGRGTYGGTMIGRGRRGKYPAKFSRGEFLAAGSGKSLARSERCSLRAQDEKFQWGGGKREERREELFFPAHTAGDEMPYIKFSSSGT